MTDFEKDVLEFRRQFEDEFHERFKRGLAKFNDDQQESRSAVEADLSGYIPDFSDATSWALDNMPEGLWFAENSQRIHLALESMADLEFFPEIPQEYLDWAKSADWSDPEMWMPEVLGRLELYKFGNFFQILMTYFQAYFSEIPDTIEHVIAYQSPKDGRVWYACRMVQAIAEAYQCQERVKDEILSNEVDAEYDLKEKLSKATQAAFTIGWLHRDRWWMERHGEAAAKYYDRATLLAEAQEKGAGSTREKYSRLKSDCLGFYRQAFEERGFAFVGAPISVVAETIREIALRERGTEYVGPGGQPLSLKWFQETLEDFQADGRHARALQDALTRKG